MLKTGPEPGPSHSIQNKETEHLLLCFCTFCSLLKGKKLSYQNIFLLLLKEKRLRDLFKTLLTVETNYEMVKVFIDFDPLITKSKYVTKFLNNNKNLKLL
jgi:hypothetical protein|tara:strand:+ start:75 stop:374 length:300 start_codon:yes stop_codon:yes gene_type:complete